MTTAADKIVTELARACVASACKYGWLEGSGYELTALDCEYIKDQFGIRLGRDPSKDEMLTAAKTAREA